MEQKPSLKLEDIYPSVTVKKKKKSSKWALTPHLFDVGYEKAMPFLPTIKGTWGQISKTA